MAPGVVPPRGVASRRRVVPAVAHWVTPVGPPRRYDTRFFVALTPSDQVATHDAGETVADQWIRPVDALAAHERGGVAQDQTYAFGLVRRRKHSRTDDDSQTTDDGGRHPKSHDVRYWAF